MSMCRPVIHFANNRTRDGDPFLASLPKEASEALAQTYDEPLAKHIQNGAQDGPHNQIESTPVIETEVLESESGAG
jgi:hypothetical protein